jgi:hypothetical protein
VYSIFTQDRNSGGLVWMCSKSQGISWVAEWPVASQEGLCSMKLVGYKIFNTFRLIMKMYLPLVSLNLAVGSRKAYFFAVAILLDGINSFRFLRCFMCSHSQNCIVLLKVAKRSGVAVMHLTYSYIFKYQFRIWTSALAVLINVVSYNTFGWVLWNWPCLFLPSTISSLLYIIYYLL